MILRFLKNYCIHKDAIIAIGKEGTVITIISAINTFATEDKIHDVPNDNYKGDVSSCKEQ